MSKQAKRTWFLDGDTIILLEKQDDNTWRVLATRPSSGNLEQIGVLHKYANGWDTDGQGPYYEKRKSAACLLVRLFLLRDKEGRA